MRRVQVGMLIMIMLAFFVLTSQTIYVHFGRYDLYLREYAMLFFLFIAELALMLAAKIYYLVSLSVYSSAFKHAGLQPVLITTCADAFLASDALQSKHVAAGILAEGDVLCSLGGAADHPLGVLGQVDLLRIRGLQGGLL